MPGAVQSNARARRLSLASAKRRALKAPSSNPATDIIEVVVPVDPAAEGASTVQVEAGASKSEANNGACNIQ